MARKLLLLLLCFSVASIAEAQHRLAGLLLDEGDKPVAAAQVLLLKAADSTLLRSALSDAEGRYSLEGVPDGDFLLRLSAGGFATPGDLPVRVEAADRELPAQKLLPLGRQLGEVVVSGRKPFIEVRPDKLVVNVENSLVAAGSSALEVLGRSPGVVVDQNDNISLRGRSGVAIWIDGRPVPMAGADLAAVLRGMPAASVERIEIISNPGARYDAAGTGGIINIITKKDRRMGANGSANASFGQGFYPAASAGLSGNYRNRKLSLYAGYNYALRYNFNHLTLQRRFYDSGGGLLYAYDQDNFTLFPTEAQALNAGGDYAVGKRTSIGLGLTGNRTAYNPKADSKAKTLGSGGELLYNYNTEGRHENDLVNGSVNLSLRHRIDTAGGELNADADYLRFVNHSRQHFRTDYSLPDGSPYLPAFILSADMRGLTQIRSLKVDFIRPLRAGWKLESGAKSSYVTADNDARFYDESSGEARYDSLRSNHFIYHENINAAYGIVSKEGPAWSMQIGLRMENTNATGRQQATGADFERRYTQLFPSVAAQYHLNGQHDIGLTLSRRIERPDYQQLNPFRYFIDKTTYREGYPYLNPALSYNIELSHSFQQRLITSVLYSVTTNLIADVIQPSDTEDSVTVQTFKNLSRMRFFGLNGAYTIPIAKWWNNVTSLDLYHAIYEGNVANTPLRRGSPAFNINTNNSFTLPKDWSAELGFFYQSHMVYGYLDLRSTWMLNAGVQKTFLQRRASLRFNITDIFWKGWPRGTSDYTGYSEYFEARRETRKATLAFIYRFGRTTVAPVRRRSGGAEEEKKRAGEG